MFRRALRLPFRLLGIPVLLDWSFLIFLPFLAWIIGAQIIQQSRNITGFPLTCGRITGAWLPYVLGFICAVGLFLSVLIHELGHSVIARLYGVNVRAITLWFLGGMAQFDEMPRQRGAEAVVAIVGPITSAIVGYICWFIAGFVHAAPATYFVFRYLWFMNIVLAVFNLIPAIPLDGGRVLRSLLTLRMPYFRATEISASISKAIAILMGLYGLFYWSPWLIIIAFFIYIAVNAETQQTYLSEMLRGIGVRDLMSREVKTVTPEMTIHELTQRMLLEHHRSFPVIDGHLMGIVGLPNIQGASPETRVDQVMSRQIPTIGEWQSANDALKKMSSEESGRLVVLDPAGQLVGILTRSDLARAMQIRMTNTAALAAMP